jgi:hypothetical protein
MQLRVDSTGEPILNQFSEEGFVDCVFKVRDLRREDGHFSFRLAASYEGKSVGCAVRLARGMKAGLSQDMSLISEHVYKPGVTLLRTGEESDRLLMALAKLYGFQNTPLHMRESEEFTAIALHQDAIDLESEPVRLKLFGRDGDETGEEYNESFFNVDLANGLVFWNEKDPEYRAPLIEGLAE